MQDFIDLSLRGIFKQDSAQRQISMQIPPGPQRIRGLAGTGKTVVLCLKAALTKLSLPEFKILFVFNTQSLYGLAEGWISNYYAKEAKSGMDWENLHVYHAWGGRTTRTGLYSSLCEKYKIDPLNFDQVRKRGSGLQAIYSHLLDSIGDNLEPIYDMILIDEAQDFPPEFFQVVYRITQKPKRIIWAYDDFQSLSEIRSRGPEALFGVDEKGNPLIEEEDLAGVYPGGIEKDFVLPNCYRNPRIILMVAHGVALGLYSERGVVDVLDNVQDWKALGYVVHKPSNKIVIEEGDQIVLERPDEFSKNNLENLLTDKKKKPNNLVQIKGFKTPFEELKFVADKTFQLINKDKIPPEEIVIITLDTRDSGDALKYLRGLLDQKDIDSIIPGIVESSNLFGKEGHVTLTTPFRAKGNEANAVFVISTQGVVGDTSFRKRDQFFVAATRSRGWLYISGVGSRFDALDREITQIKNNVPQFAFTRPSDEYIKRQRSILSESHSVKQAKILIEQIAKKNPEAIEILRKQLNLFTEYKK